ncbi:TPA: type I restriction endonuclease subunit R [Clostridium sporogenes]
MSEYLSVEKPFLDQLQNLGWTIINHGENCIPQDPKVSLRENFRELVIKKEFKKWVKKINETDDGIEWLTDKQLDELYNMLTKKVNYPSLLETNKAIMELLIETKPRVDRNEVTGQENPSVKLIDFENPKNNHFLAINQFRINTVGTAKKFIIPDIVLFINGIPIVVIECKIACSFASDAMEEGIRQLLRYQNRRLNTAGKREKEGEEALFYYNQFMISTYGDEARVGTVSSDYEHYLEWKSIYPKKYEKFHSPLGKKRSQEILIQGMLNKENLLKIVKHFIVFKPLEEKKEIKIVCRYQQFRAVQKIVDKLLTGNNHSEKSGVIWHTQGSGKSLTMVFLIRQIRFMNKLKDYKIIMINDRTDLEEQLGETAKLTGETVNYVEKARDMKSKLSGNSSDLTLVMMHKFGDKIKETKLTRSLKDAGIIEEDMLPEVEELGVVNASDRILILIDEAHRTQNNPLGLSGNLVKAFPNSTQIAFTGTPLISGKNKKKTIEIFGNNKNYIDKYRAKDSVEDGATLQILYLGRKDRIKLKEKEFEFEFNREFKNKSPKEIEEINKRYGAYKDFLESDDHIKKVSKDIVNHYSKEILVNGFKAQVVCISKLATVKYKRFIDEAIGEKVKKLENNRVKDDDLIKKLKFLKTAIVISDDGNDPADMARLSKESRDLDAIKNFKKEYNYEKTQTGIGILIVCSRLLTGFDASIEQVMYLDKIMKEHTLFQAITRVNRTHKNKYKGYIVDYIGISNNLIDTLKMYSGDKEDEESINTIANVNTEKPILRDRYNRIINLFLNKGVEEIEDYILYKIKKPEKQYEVLEKCIEVCENVETRAQFEVYYKRYLASLDILINLDIDEKYKSAMRAFGHIQVRIKNRYKDDSINLVGVGEKVKALINKHVESKGISNKIPPLELFDVGFKENLYKHKNIKAKASEMEHAMRKEITIKRHTDPALYDSFLEKLKEILKKHSEDMEARFEAMEKLYEEMKKGRKGMTYNNDLDPEKEAPFYDLLINIIFKNVNIVDNEDKLKNLIRDIVKFISEEIRRANFWGSPAEIETLKSSIGEKLLFSNIEIMEDKEEFISSEFVKLAKSNHNVLVS